MHSPATQSDIARALGVSKNTVSMALRNHPKISAEMRAKVAGVARRMDYQINASARALAVQRSRALEQRVPLALLNLWNPPGFWKKKRWTRQIHEGCARRAQELGYYIEEIEFRGAGMTAKQANRILKSRGIRGVLIPPTPYSHSHLNLEWKHFAPVAIGMTFRRPNLHRVAPNLPLSLQLALHHLKHARYKRIGLLLDQAFLPRTDGSPESDFLYYQKDLPAGDRVPIFWGTWQNFGQKLPAWLKRHRPDVIMAYWDGVLPWLGKAGYSIPDDVGYVHLDWDESLEERVGVESTGINVENLQAGARAVDLVVSLLERGEYGIPAFPTITLVTPHWIPGKTIRH